MSKIGRPNALEPSFSEKLVFNTIKEQFKGEAYSEDVVKVLKGKVSTNHVRSSLTKLKNRWGMLESELDTTKPRKVYKWKVVKEK